MGDSNPTGDDRRQCLRKEMRTHQVAIGELNSLAPSRAVYQRNGNLFFRTTAQMATSAEQKSLDAAKAEMEKAESSSSSSSSLKK